MDSGLKGFIKKTSFHLFRQKTSLCGTHLFCSESCKGKYVLLGGGGCEEWEGAIPAIQAEKARAASAGRRTRRVLRRRLSCIHVFLWGRPAPPQLPGWELAGQASARSAWHQRHQGPETSPLSSRPASPPRRSALRPPLKAKPPFWVLATSSLQTRAGPRWLHSRLGPRPLTRAFAVLGLGPVGVPEHGPTEVSQPLADRLWQLHGLVSAPLTAGRAVPKATGAPGLRRAAALRSPLGASCELGAWKGGRVWGKAGSFGESWPDAIGQIPSSCCKPSILETSRNNNK